MGCTLPRAPAVKALSEGSEGQQQGSFSGSLAAHIGKDSDAGRDWGQEEKGRTEDEMAGWHHGLGECESE